MENVMCLTRIRVDKGRRTKPCIDNVSHILEIKDHKNIFSPGSGMIGWDAFHSIGIEDV